MSVLQPLESVQLGDRTFESIRAAIIVGELPPGQPLRDRDLAEILGVSRTPVREALYRLEHAGLVEPRDRSGWLVTPFGEQDVCELFELRRALEPLGIDRLVREPDETAIAELAAAFHNFDKPIPTERYEEYFAADNAFHKRLVVCCGNARLQRFYADIEGHIDRGRYLLSMGAVGRVDETLDEHLAVARALAARDFQLARRSLIRHLDTGQELMLDYLRQQVDQ